MPTKLVITNPWEALCVDLIGPYTLKGQDGTVIDFMCLTMIDPATSWLEVVELPATEDSVIPMDTKGHKGKMTHTTAKQAYFDKSSAMISILVNKTWFSQYQRCMTMEATLNFTLKAYAMHMALSVSRPVSKTHKRMQYWSMCIK